VERVRGKASDIQRSREVWGVEWRGTGARGTLECFISLGEAHGGPSSAWAKRRGAVARYWVREAVHEIAERCQGIEACYRRQGRRSRLEARSGGEFQCSHATCSTQCRPLENGLF
jgi:hypothetical protein